MKNIKRPKGPLNILLLGTPGSGKGTQATLLTRRFNLKHIDMGDLLRQRVKGNTYFDKRLSATMDRGEMVPTWFIIHLFFRFIERTGLKRGIITEGNPRKLIEAIDMDSILDWLNRKNTKVIYLKVRISESKKRMSSRRICSRCHFEVSLRLTPNIKKCPKCHGRLIRRKDDNPKTINTRFDIFKRDILPIVRHYKKKRILIEVNGEGPIDKIFKNILKKLRNK